jgi:hypothetical protein
VLPFLRPVRVPTWDGEQAHGRANAESQELRRRFRSALDCRRFVVALRVMSAIGWCRVELLSRAKSAPLYGRPQGFRELVKLVTEMTSASKIDGEGASSFERRHLRRVSLS